MKTIFAIGNALVDHEFEISDAALEKTGLAKGSMTLASLLEQSQLRQVLAAEDASQTKMAGGGSAANTAFAVAALGGQAALACRVSDDAAGRFYLNDLHASGVRTSDASMVKSRQATGSCVVLVTPDAERTMQTHLGAASELEFDHIDDALIAAADYFYIEGYLASSESAVTALGKMRATAKADGKKVALSFADPSMVRFCKEGLLSIIGDGVDVLFCNLEEALTFTETEALPAASAALLELSPLVVITLGADGAVVCQPNQVPLNIPAAHVSKVVDTNGAGDNFAGAFMYGLAADLSLLQCGTLAAKVAARLIGAYGPRLEVGEYLTVKNG